MGIAAALGGVLLGLAGIRGAHAWFDAWRCRRLGDRLLRTYPRSTVPSPLADWRAVELTSERTRRRLVKRLEGLTRAAEPSFPVLRRLESRLGDLSRPVSPYGILVVRELADGASSPFHRPGRAGELPDALAEALAALDDSR